MSIFLVTAVFLLLSVVSVSFGAVVDECTVQVPLVIDLSHVIAGAQFAFEYSTGLEFVSYEKSEAVFSALTTPVVVKNGYTYLGFYNVDNRYAPENGKLDMGYLVFNCLNDDSQQVTMTEIKLVQVGDDGTTRSEFLAPVEIKVSSENGVEALSVDGDDGALLSGDKVSSVDGDDGALLSGDKVSSVDDGALLSGDKDLLVDNSEGSWLSVGFWIALVFLFVVVCCAGVFIIMKKRVNVK